MKFKTSGIILGALIVLSMSFFWGDITRIIKTDLFKIDGTGAITVPAGTEAQRPSTPENGMFRYNSSNGKFEGYATAWGEIGGGGGGDNFDYLFTYEKGDADGQPDTSAFETGNNTAIQGGGTLVGTLSLDTTAANLLDADNTAKVMKYLGVAGNETNDYVCWPDITIPQSVRNAANSSYQSILFTAWYWHNFTDTAVDIKAYCSNGVEAGEIRTGSRDTKLTSTDWDNDNVKDANEGDMLFGGTGIAFAVHEDCAVVNLCFKINEDVNAGEMLLMDRVKVGVLPSNAVDVSYDPVEYSISQAGDALSNRDGAIQFNSGTATITDGGLSNFATINHASDPSTWTFKTTGTLTVDSTLMVTTGGNVACISLNGVVKNLGSASPSNGSSSTANRSFTVRANDIVTVGICNGSFAFADSVNNAASINKVNMNFMGW